MTEEQKTTIFPLTKIGKFYVFDLISTSSDCSEGKFCTITVTERPANVQPNVKNNSTSGDSNKNDNGNGNANTININSNGAYGVNTGSIGAITGTISTLVIIWIHYLIM